MRQPDSHLGRQRRIGPNRSKTLTYGLVTVCSVGLLVSCKNQPQLSTPKASPTPTASDAASSPAATPSPESSPKSQATKDLETRLSKAFTDSTNVPLQSIDCPAQFEVKAGTNLTCQATSNGQPFTIAVQLTNADGQFQWSTKGLLLLSKLEQFIQTRIHDKSGLDVKADCGGTVRVAKPGDTFDCKVKGAQDQARSAQVKVKDDQGSVDISLR